MLDARVGGGTPLRLLRPLASMFWVSIFLTFSVDASIASLWLVFVPGDARVDHRLMLFIVILAVVIIGAVAQIARRAVMEADEQRRLAETRRVSMPVARSGYNDEERIFLIVDEASVLANDTPWPSLRIRT